MESKGVFPLEAEVGLQISKLGICTRWINARHYALAPGACVVRRERKTVAQWHVHTDVPDVGQGAVTAAGAARVTEGVRLKCAATAVP